jgi:hypothetical protein
MRTLVLVSSLVLASCGGSQSKPVEPSAAPAASSAEVAAAPPKTGLIIKESKFMGGGATITLREDGRIEGPDGKTKATLTTDGKLIGASSGKVVATIDTTGKVVFPDGSEATIDEDGTIHLGGESVRLSADGTIEGDKTGTKIMVSDPAGRRAAMFVVFVLTMPKAAAPPK